LPKDGERKMNSKGKLIDQEQLCKACVWKSQTMSEKVLCFFPECVYRMDKTETDGAGNTYTQYTNTISRQRVIIMHKAKKKKRNQSPPIIIYK